MKRRWYALLFLAALVGLSGQRADASRTPLTDVRASITQPHQLTAATAASDQPADVPNQVRDASTWIVESIIPLGTTADGQPLALISLLVPLSSLDELSPVSTRAGPYAAPETHTRVFCIVQPPLGLQALVPAGASAPVRYGGGQSLPPSQSWGATLARGMARAQSDALGEHIAFLTTLGQHGRQAYNAQYSPIRHWGSQEWEVVNALRRQASSILRDYESPMLVSANPVDQANALERHDREFALRASMYLSESGQTINGLLRSTPAYTVESGILSYTLDGTTVSVPVSQLHESVATRILLRLSEADVDAMLSASASKTATQLALPPIRHAEGGLVIGRGADLNRSFALAPNEFRLSWPATATTRSEWKINSGLLRTEMGKGIPIRDASPGNVVGMYLNAERNLLQSRGWKYNASTGYWNPPGN